MSKFLEAIDGARAVKVAHDLGLTAVWYGGIDSGDVVFVFDKRGNEVDEFDLLHDADVLYPYSFDQRVDEYFKSRREGADFIKRVERSPRVNIHLPAPIGIAA